MKTGLALPDLAAELKRQLDTKEDYVADTRKVSLHSTGEDSTPGQSIVSLDDASLDGGIETFAVADYAHGQIAERIQIPRRYYDRLREDAPELLDRNVNHWLWNAPELRMLRTLDGRLRAFLSNRYHRIDNYDVFGVVYPIVAEIPGAEIVSADLTERKMYVKYTFPTIRAELKVGSVIQAGGVVENSEVGAGAFSIAPWSLVIDCLNGMKHTEFGTRKTHLGGRLDEGRVRFSEETLRAVDEAFKLEVRDIVKQTATQQAFDLIVTDLRELADLELDAPAPAVVEKLGVSLDLTDGETATVLDHLIRGGDLSAWGYVNAVTRTAEDAESYDRASEIEALGGKLAAQDESEWSALVRVAA